MRQQFRAGAVHVRVKRRSSVHMGPQVPDQTLPSECPGHCHKGNGVVSWALLSECPGHCHKGNGVVSWALPSE